MKRRSKVSGKIKGLRETTPNPKRRSVPKDAPAPHVPNSENELEVHRLTRELSEAREQQAATSEVLKAIGGSTFDLRTVLDTLLRSAVRLCSADQGTVAQRKGDTFYRSVSYGFSPAYLEYVKDIPVKPGRDTGTGRALLEGKVIHISDVLADPDFTWKEGQRLGGFRTVLGVPMLRDGIAMGVFALTRSAVRPFSDEQIAQVENFAAQAVIAIENARLLNELRRSLEQQTATSEVLQVISSFPGALEPVFVTMLEKAVRICEAKFGSLYLREDGKLRLVAAHDVPEFLEARRGVAFDPAPGGGLEEAIRNKCAVQIPDLAATKSYIERHPGMVEAVELAGIRTGVAVPMVKDDEVIGVIAIHRREVLPFTDKQVELLTNFAAQAVIAIENVRLLSELRQSLGQQTATADVLKVISRSTFDLQKVLDTLVTSAAQLCRAERVSITLPKGERYHRVASFGFSAEFRDFLDRHSLVIDRGNIVGRVVLESRTIQIEDVEADPEFTFMEALRIGKARTLLGVPLMRQGKPTGVLVLTRSAVEPFNDKQIELVETFADQAVIAIENARLLNELRQRTAELTARTTDLTEALEQQTATSEVLQVISGSPGDLQPVFAAMLDKAARICDAKFGNIFRWDGDALWLVATHNTPPAFTEHRRRVPFRPNQANPIGQMLKANSAIHVADLAQDERYIQKSDPEVVAAVELGGIRTFVAVPMLKDEKLIGTVILYRQEVRPFTDKQIELVKNFAAQAVIAIENARLLNELRERTDEVEKLNEQLEQRVADQVGEIERMGRLRRFLPPQVADLIVASGSEKQLESHRREITALFCDLRGFTGFTESADAEDVMGFAARLPCGHWRNHHQIQRHA